MAEIRKMTMKELMNTRAKLIGKYVSGKATEKENLKLLKIEREIHRRG